MTEDVNQDRTPGILELLFDLVKARLGTIVVLTVIGGLIATWIGFDLSIPRRFRLVFFTFVFMLPFGYIVGNYLVQLLWNPNWIFLVDFDARDRDGALYRFPFDSFRDLDVLDGELCQLTPHLYVGKAVDLEAGTAVGTWHGTLNDRELARALQKVRECRDLLEDDARKGFVLETSAFVVVERAARRTALQVIETFKTGTLPDGGEALSSAVDDALHDFELDKELEDSILEQDPDVEEVARDPVEDVDDPEAPDGIAGPQPAPEAADD